MPIVVEAGGNGNLTRELGTSNCMSFVRFYVPYFLNRTPFWGIKENHATGHGLLN